MNIIINSKTREVLDNWQWVRVVAGTEVGILPAEVVIF